MQQTKLEHIKSQMAIFKTSLEQFAIKHRYDWSAHYSPNNSCCPRPLEKYQQYTAKALLQFQLMPGTLTLQMHIRASYCSHAYWLLCRSDIRQDPVFRAQFHTMCANVGVDPLASNKGMWAQLLGFGDFYYELGVQIVEACLATKAYNGGFMELEALQASVQVVLFVSKCMRPLVSLP